MKKSVKQRSRPRTQTATASAAVLNTQEGAWTKARAVHLASELLDRMNLARTAGLQYEGQRDIATVAGYLRNPTYNDFVARFRRQDIAGKIVEIPAETTWRKPPEVVEPDKDETAFTKAFAELAKRLNLWHRFERTDRLAGLGRFALLFIGSAGDDLSLKQPMTKLAGPNAVLYLGSHGEGSVKIEEWETDAGNERFGLPILYRISLSSGQAGFPKGTLVVHHTRVIHIAEDLLDDEVYGRPRLERVLNRLNDLEKIVASSGESFWQLATRILQLKVDKDAQLSPAQLAELDEQTKEIMHDLRRQISMQGGEASWLTSDPADPASAAKVVMQLIAAACGIPSRILFGSETGERASSEDQKSWLGSMARRQEIFAGPVMVRPFIDRLIEFGALPRPGKDGYDLIWPPLFEVDEKTVAETDKLVADTAAALTPIGGDPAAMIGVTDEGRVYLAPRDPPATPREIVEPVEPETPGGPGADEPEDEPVAKAA